jgi:hypothetical protein
MACPWGLEARRPIIVDISKPPSRKSSTQSRRIVLLIMYHYYLVVHHGSMAPLPSGKHSHQRLSHIPCPRAITLHLSILLSTGACMIEIESILTRTLIYRFWTSRSLKGKTPWQYTHVLIYKGSNREQKMRPSGMRKHMCILRMVYYT